MSQADLQFENRSSPIVWGLLIGLGYGLLFGYLSSLFWLIGVPAVFLAVAVVGDSIRLLKKMGNHMPTFWFSTLLGAFVADFLIIMIPLGLATFTSDLEGTAAEKLQVIWKFYLLSLNSVGSSLILTVTAGIGLIGLIGVYRRIYVINKD